jgi:hypothetical protein
VIDCDDICRIWLDVGIFRMLGKVSAYYVDEEVLEFEALDELRCAIEHWVFLAVADRLGPLVNHESVKAIKEVFGPGAETLYAYMDLFKAEQGFEEWTPENMTDLRVSIYKVVAAIPGHDRSLAASRGKTKDLSREMA